MRKSKKLSVVMEMKIYATVYLNDYPPNSFSLPPKIKEKAEEALLSALPETVDIFIDGENKEPASVFIESHQEDIEHIEWDRGGFIT